MRPSRVAAILMRRLRLAQLLAIGVVLAVGGVAAWAIADRGYQGVVYYQDQTYSGTFSGHAVSDRVQSWADPQQQRLRVQQGHTRSVWSDGWQYLATGTMQPQRERITASSAADLARTIAQLQHDTLDDPGGAAQALAHGPTRRVQLDGRAALRVDIADPREPGRHMTVWIDPRTKQLLQEEYITSDTNATVRLSAPRRLPPGTLPADFFDPPFAHRSLWGEATGWLRAHLGLGGA